MHVIRPEFALLFIKRPKLELRTAPFVLLTILIQIKFKQSTNKLST